MLLVSAIVLTKDRLNLLKRALKSVLNQTYTKLEIIIVDDNSSDGTKDYCTELEKTHSNIKYIKINEKDSRGQNYARNVGVENSKGKYVAFLDDDDEWYPEKIERYVYAFENSVNPNIGIVYGMVEKINSYNNGKYIFKKILAQDLLSDLNCDKKILYYNHIGCSSNPMIKREAFIEVGGFDTDLIMMTDFELWIRICQKYDSLYVGKILTKYYSENNGRQQITNSVDKLFIARNYINEKHKKLMNTLNKQEIKEQKLNDYNLACQRFILIKDVKNYRKYLYKSMRIDFSFGKIIKYFLSFLGADKIIKLNMIKSIIRARNI